MSLFCALLLAGFLGTALDANAESQPASDSSLHSSKSATGSNQKTANMPYRVKGTTYYPIQDVTGYTEEGLASWYGPKFHGKKTSNSETYNMHSLTAAHKTLPFNSKVRVTNLINNRSIVVRINDRGPFVGQRIIDLSFQAGKRLNMVKLGTVPVRIQVINSREMEARNAKSTPLTESFSVQVGIFKNRENAERLAKRVRGGQVHNTEQDGQTLYRVLTSFYNTFDQAQRRMDELRLKGLSNVFVIPTP